ncbi:AP-1-like transcription factor [Madurella mycetomatis]|uniref:AP-1-like transcription factor n=1 Tax=Madurella mycetomatis TaxID=100816 RepID=A0A175WF22_9PEZI|nr:AP-1-like transcription factor [Madurella mycetomatis]
MRNPASRTSEDGPRKRAKTQQTESVLPEDGKKKLRGRPRLDVQDETPADRRRTQIRLAQRAYRNRKETTIQTLEKRVQQLKDINEEMSNTFMQLHDFAVSAGLLDRIPEFGHQLRLTTEKFLALAHLVNDDGARDHEELTASANTSPMDKATRKDGRHPDSQEQTGSGSPASTTTTTTTTTPPSVTAALTDEGPKEQLYGGIIVTHEPVDVADSATHFPSSAPEPSTASAFDYGMVTDPILENASSLVPSRPDLDFLEKLTASFTHFGLEAPASYCSLETTFGRRLQRFALQCGLALLTMPYPPQRAISQVFGFCFLFETPEDIKRRLNRVLNHNTQQSLSNWQYPFFHLGRAGTHLDMTTTTSSPQRRIGNQGTIDVDKPKTTAGFATGPFTAEINGVRDHLLDKDMRMEIPGFGYEYYDCDEIEMYLYQRGVVIPPGADYITTDIDPSHFDNEALETDFSSNIDFASVPPDPAGQRKSNVSSSLSPEPSLGSGPTSTEPSPPGPDMSAMPWPLPETTGLVEPTISDVFSQAGTYLPTSTTPPGTFLSPTDPHNLLTFPLLPPSGDSIAGLDITPATPKPTRKRVIVDVGLLVKEMTLRSVCLGRTPGLKQKDINAAFWAAVQVDLGL